MSPTSLRLTCAVLVLVAAAGVSADGPVTKSEAELLKKKVASIAAFGGPAASKGQHTTISERELNAYLNFDAQPQLPAGVLEPSVAILGTGRLSGRAVVDLDVVRKAKRPSTGLFDPMSFLTGRLPVTATGILRTGDGKGRFELQSATVGGLPIPKTMLQEIVGHYSRTPANPTGLDIEGPFPLPSGIREIHVESGQAVIVQ